MEVLSTVLTLVCGFVVQISLPFLSSEYFLEGWGDFLTIEDSFQGLSIVR